MSIAYLPAGINGVICLCIVFVSICRLDKIDRNVLLRVGVQYVVLIMAAAAQGLSPLMFELPGWPAVCFAAAVLFMLVADSYQWRTGPPSSATDHAPLGEF